MADNDEEKSMCENDKVNEKSKKKHAKRQMCNWVSVVLLLLNVLLLAISITVVIIWRTSGPSEDMRKQGSMSLRDSLCLPCADISMHEDDDEENSKDFKREKQNDGSWVCCAEGGRQLDRLIEMFVEKRYREDKANKRFCQAGYDGSTATTKPAARVFGFTAVPNGNPADKTVHWKSESFKHDGVEFINNNHFQIPSAGYYYVYTQVTLNEEDTINSVLSKSDAVIYHLVFKKNDGIEVKLLENYESRCKLHTKNSNSTSYIGAVFRLNENDEIYVKFSHPERISQSAHGNYFGVHLI